MSDTNRILVGEWVQVMSYSRFERLNRSDLSYLKVPPEQLVPLGKHAQILKGQKWRRQQRRRRRRYWRRQQWKRAWGQNLEQDRHNQDGVLEASYHKLVMLVLLLIWKANGIFLPCIEICDSWSSISGLINGKTSVDGFPLPSSDLSLLTVRELDRARTPKVRVWLRSLDPIGWLLSIT